MKLFELELSKVQKVRAERQPTGELVGKADDTQTRLETAHGRRHDRFVALRRDQARARPPRSSTSSSTCSRTTSTSTTTRTTATRSASSSRRSYTTDRASSSATGRILAAEYKGKAGTFQTFYLRTASTTTTKGESSESGMLKTPLKFARVSSGFDRKRMHPVLHTVRAHLGIDYAAPDRHAGVGRRVGTIVTFRGPTGGAGNLVMIRHDGGIETAYMHLVEVRRRSKVGQRIEAKTVIGYVGTTGLSTGPHLHFGVKKNGAYIDPSKLAPMRGKGVPSRAMPAFREEATRLRELMDGVKKLGPPTT